MYLNSLFRILLSINFKLEIPYGSSMVHFEADCTQVVVSCDKFLTASKYCENGLLRKTLIIAFVVIVIFLVILLSSNLKVFGRFKNKLIDLNNSNLF